jgi:hypothetical protein
MTDEGTEEQTSTPPRRPSMLQEAERTAARLDELNEQLEKKLQRLEELQVEQTLSGKATVNNTAREESPEEYAEKAMRGELHGSYE